MEFRLLISDNTREYSILAPITIHTYSAGLLANVHNLSAQIIFRQNFMLTLRLQGPQICTLWRLCLAIYNYRRACITRERSYLGIQTY